MHLVCLIKHLLVITSKIGTPLPIDLMNSFVMGLFTSTTYSFSCWLFALNILFTISPSLVKKINPSAHHGKQLVDVKLDCDESDNLSIKFRFCSLSL